MTKAQEIALLDRTIEAFGPSSYLGPWLREYRDELVADIQGDRPPGALLPRAAQVRADLLVHDARATAEEIRQQATAAAKRLVDQAHADATVVRRHALDALDAARRQLCG